MYEDYFICLHFSWIASFSSKRFCSNSVCLKYRSEIKYKFLVIKRRGQDARTHMEKKPGHSLSIKFFLEPLVEKKLQGHLKTYGEEN